MNVGFSYKNIQLMQSITSETVDVVKRFSRPLPTHNNYYVHDGGGILVSYTSLTKPLGLHRCIGRNFAHPGMTRLYVVHWYSCNSPHE